MGIRPFDCPFVPRMYDFVAQMQWIARPMPPAFFEIIAVCFKVSKIPSIESSLIASKKQELI
jgi:hypothetical protein